MTSQDAYGATRDISNALSTTMGWVIVDVQANVITAEDAANERYTLTVEQVFSPLADGEVPAWPT